MQAKKQLVQSSVRAFASQNTFLGSVNPARSNQLRVMSTPTWPVPYYQRLARHPVNTGDISKGDLTYIEQDINDGHAILAKERLRELGLGYVVEAVENHADTTTYATSFEHCGPFCKAYSEDLLDCLTVGFEQNKRVLNDIDLADALQ